MTTHTDTPLVLSRHRLLMQAMTRQFSDRPTLRRVVNDLLVNTLRKQFTPSLASISLEQLNIIWTVDDAEQVLTVARRQPLLDAVLDHIALDTPVNYTFYEPEQCYLALLPQRRVRINEQKTFEVTEFDVTRHYDQLCQPALGRRLDENGRGGLHRQTL